MNMQTGASPAACCGVSPHLQTAFSYPEEDWLPDHHDGVLASTAWSSQHASRIFSMQRGSLVGFLLLLLCQAALANGLYNSLYVDRRGKQVGDVITVMVIEASKASNESGTQTQKDHSVSANAEKATGLLDFLPSFGFGAGTNANYKGSGETKREGSLKATVTARIVEVLDNGNLMIQGSKVVEINSEKEILEVSGLIRQEDVGPENTVYSFNIADAKIVYTGNGNVFTGQRPGLVARFFNWLF